MTTTILVPSHVPAIAEMTATAEAASVTAAFRSTAASMSDVSEWMTAHGAPADWTGDASEAATHAKTLMAVTSALRRLCGRGLSGLSRPRPGGTAWGACAPGPIPTTWC